MHESVIIIIIIIISSCFAQVIAQHTHTHTQCNSLIKQVFDAQEETVVKRRESGGKVNVNRRREKSKKQLTYHWGRSSSNDNKNGIIWFHCFTNLLALQQHSSCHLFQKRWNVMNSVCVSSVQVPFWRIEYPLTNWLYSSSMLADCTVQ